MKKILIYCFIYLGISIAFYVFTIDFNKKDFMCENVRKNSIETCNNVNYFIKETPLGALVHLLFYPFILFLFLLFLISKKHKSNS